MSTAFDAGRLGRTDVLTLQQVTSFMSNDMQVTGPDGQTVATVVTTGGGLGRMVLGSRTFDVVDGEDGRVLFRLADPATFGRDRYAIVDADGLPLANLVREFALFRTSVSVEVVDGTRFAVTGNLWDLDYAMTVGQVPIARATAAFGGFMNALAGRSRYELRLDPGMPPVVRCAVLGTAIALDLIRAKDRRRNN
ncbi:LURP-one-related/scramblase family protein [Micrococcus endophyticus]|uniref:LURP-one-related/scramblase family protein n=1 Tax=Micrococcus endophyticus TaxID=455343 RepID=UPI00381C73CF